MVVHLIVSVPVGPVVFLGHSFVVGCRWILLDCPSRLLPLIVSSGTFIQIGGPLLEFTHRRLYLSEVDSGLGIIRL